MIQNKQVGILGASSFVGKQILNLLTQSDWNVLAFSRQARKNNHPKIKWKRLPFVRQSPSPLDKKSLIPLWICIAPIWVLPDHFRLLESYGVKRIIAFSSTSRYTKENSSDPSDQAVAQQLIDGEARLQHWAESKGIEWFILRPTMVYGMGKDKNITEIIRLIRHWKFFPILGKGLGLRQPIHVKDVATACISVMLINKKNQTYTLSGGEILTYKEMITRIFKALDKTPRFLHLPRWSFHLALVGLRLFPRFRHWSVSMVDRMDQDLVFDHQQTITDLNFSARAFRLEEKDLP